LKPGDRNQPSQRRRGRSSGDKSPPATDGTFLHADFHFICISSYGNLAFSVEIQEMRLHVAQAEPKINLADRPILDLKIQIEGYGHFRGKARLMLPRTTDGVS
jgi:hypothetical protein